MTDVSHVSPAPLEEAGVAVQRQSRSLFGRFRQSRVGMFGALLFLVLAAVGISAPHIAPYSPILQASSPLLQPSMAHLLGTDELGRDILSRVIAGSRLSLATALGAALLAALIGTPVGIVAGYFGGIIDGIAMRLTDFMLALPGILSALVLIVVLGSNAVNVAIAIAIGSSPAFARLARASTLEVKTRAFVRAARTMGAGPFDIMLRTIAPSVVPPLIVQFVVTASLAVLASAALSFLGLGAPPPTPNWGSMLFDAQSYLWELPIYGIAPGIALTVTVVAFDAIGKGITHAVGAGRSGGNDGPGAFV